MSSFLVSLAHLCEQIPGVSYQRSGQEVGSCHPQGASCVDLSQPFFDVLWELMRSRH